MADPPFSSTGSAGGGPAFRYMEQHAVVYERMSMHDDRVVIERWVPGSVNRFKFNRHWARLVISDPRRMERGRLALRSHSKEVEFGTLLTTDEQLCAMARRLRKHLNVG